MVLERLNPKALLHDLKESFALGQVGVSSKNLIRLGVLLLA